MIKCYFVDVKSISSTIPKSKFKKAEIDRLADAILANDGLLRPLILQQTDVEKYTVIEGHREYYAAVTAKEKDIKKAEMVNAFIIDNNSHRSAIEQLDLLTQPQPSSPIVDPIPDSQLFTDLLTESIDRLLPTITAAISTQLQPIFAQLVEHQQILGSIKLELVNNLKHKSEEVPKTVEIITPALTVELPQPEVKPTKEPKPKIDRQKKIGTVKAKGSDSPDTKPVKITETTPKKNSTKTKPADKSPSSIPVAIEPETQIITTDPSTKIAQPVQEPKQMVGIGSIESDKFTNALNLINTLNRDDLTLRMQRSGVLPAIIKLIPEIILQRDLQPARTFDTWEAIVKAKIAGLTATKVQGMIKKLK